MELLRGIWSGLVHDIVDRSSTVRVDFLVSHGGLEDDLLCPTNEISGLCGRSFLVLDFDLSCHYVLSMCLHVVGWRSCLIKAWGVCKLGVSLVKLASDQVSLIVLGAVWHFLLVIIAMGGTRRVGLTRPRLTEILVGLRNLVGMNCGIDVTLTKKRGIDHALWCAFVTWIIWVLLDVESSI